MSNVNFNWSDPEYLREVIEDLQLKVAALETKVAASSVSTNTGSPKLLAELHDAMLFSSAGALYKTTDLYQRVCEQLRAGA